MNLFPESSLAWSFVVPVWAGVCVICVLNLLFGWTLSGLVVPGLVVPVLIASPGTGILIILEAVLTFLIVRWISSLLPHTLDSSHLFGRDRFFAMLLVSVAVRVVMETLVVPGWIIAFGYVELSGIALVVVPLMANQLWKPGLVRGLSHAVLSIGLTWLIVHFVIGKLTNFELNNLSLLLDSVNARIDNTPRAYMVLLMAAFVASRLNLKYGWEVGGILFPALLALSWFDPPRLIATLIEGVVLYAIASFILALPALRSKGLQGATRILFFFQLAFFYRIIVGHVAQYAYPSIWGGDFLGIGFLISTLLAIRAYEKDVGLRVIRSVGQVSFIGAIAGFFAAIVCLALVDGIASLPSLWDPSRSDDPRARQLISRSCRPRAVSGVAQTNESKIETTNAKNAEDFFRTRLRENPELIASAHSQQYLPPLQEDLDRFRQYVLFPLFQQVSKSWSGQERSKSVEEVKGQLLPLQIEAERFGYRISIVAIENSAEPLVVLAENEKSLCHRGIVFLRWGQAVPTSIQVSRAGEEFNTFSAGLMLFDEIKAAALIAPTSHIYANFTDDSNLTLLPNRQNVYIAATEALARAVKERDFLMMEAFSMPTPNHSNATESKDWPQLVLSGEDIDEGVQDPEGSVIERLSNVGYSVKVRDGSLETAFASEPSLALTSIALRAGPGVEVAALSMHTKFTADLEPIFIRDTQFPSSTKSGRAPASMSEDSP